MLDGSVSGQFERFEIGPGSITFYIGAPRHPGDIRYTLVGYVPGEFRVAQSLLRSFYDPSQMAISEVKALAVLAAGEQSADEYRLTPDELYHLGQQELAKANDLELPDENTPREKAEAIMTQFQVIMLSEQLNRLLAVE